jgi:hypothetical protein
MPESRRSPELSRRELFVLARLSVPEPPSKGEIVKDLLKYAPKGITKAEAGDVVVAAVAQLRHHDLVTDRPDPKAAKAKPAKEIKARKKAAPPPPHAPPKRDPDRMPIVTDAGRSALRKEFDTSKGVSWKEIRDQHVPTLASGATHGTSTTKRKPAEPIQIALLAPQLKLARTTTIGDLLDDFVARELGLPPGKVTMDRIRTHLLARYMNIEHKGKAPALAARLAGKSVRASDGGLKGLRPALMRRWLEEDVAASRTATPTDAEAARVRPADAEPAHAEPARPAESVPRAPRQEPPPASADHGQFAAIIQDAAHHVGADGRFGPHKVFISAIWRKLAEEPMRHIETLEELKQGLLDANRAGKLQLARADLVGAMNADEVLRSEIKDAGSSFHFVID